MVKLIKQLHQTWRRHRPAVAARGQSICVSVLRRHRSRSLSGATYSRFTRTQQQRGNQISWSQIVTQRNVRAIPPWFVTEDHPQIQFSDIFSSTAAAAAQAKSGRSEGVSMSQSTARSLHPPETQHGFSDMVSADDFKSAFRNHPAGVAVITADVGAGPVGLTATSVISVSANPPLVVFSLSSASSSTPTVKQAETVVIHLLGAEQIGLARNFATSGIDRFADASTWSRLITGEPYLPAANAWMRGRIVNRMEAGDSTVVAVQVLQVSVPSESSRGAQESRPLVYHNRTWHSLSRSSVVG
jgi:flavin reductase (DIM6/NTAB) family NADH-FMN oxidoreductase RutF